MPEYWMKAERRRSSVEMLKRVLGWSWKEGWTRAGAKGESLGELERGRRPPEEGKENLGSEDDAEDMRERYGGVVVSWAGWETGSRSGELLLSCTME